MDAYVGNKTGSRSATLHSVMQYDLLVVVVPHNTSKLKNTRRNY
jgi:hypothetical protein